MHSASTLGTEPRRMNEQPVIGLDLGGTNIKARLVDRAGNILAAVDLPSEIEYVLRSRLARGWLSPPRAGD